MDLSWLAPSPSRDCTACAFYENHLILFDFYFYPRYFKIYRGSRSWILFLLPCRCVLTSLWKFFHGMFVCLFFLAHLECSTRELMGWRIIRQSIGSFTNTCNFFSLRLHIRFRCLWVGVAPQNMNLLSSRELHTRFR